jgi:hypothetical protein
MLTVREMEMRYRNVTVSKMIKETIMKLGIGIVELELEHSSTTHTHDTSIDTVSSIATKSTDFKTNVLL